jgi:hypothetical protein
MASPAPAHRTLTRIGWPMARDDQYSSQLRVNRSVNTPLESVHGACEGENGTWHVQGIIGPLFLSICCTILFLDQYLAQKSR